MIDRFFASHFTCECGTRFSIKKKYLGNIPLPITKELSCPECKSLKIRKTWKDMIADNIPTGIPLLKG